MLLPPIIIMTHDHTHALNTKITWWVYHVESVPKMGLVLSITFIAIYGVAYVELVQLSLGDWKDIFITHLIIIIVSEVPTFPADVIFFHGTLGPCVRYWCSVYGICKWSHTLDVFVCLQITPSHYHHYEDLSESIELLKCLSGICCRVFV